MEPYALMRSAALLFGLAALGGLLMAGMRLTGSPRPPAWLAMGHGMLAAAGLTLLIYAAVSVGVPILAQYAIALLILAAIGGVAMNLLYHWKMMALPVPLMILHALLAIAGFGLLLMVIFGQPQIQNV